MYILTQKSSSVIPMQAIDGGDLDTFHIDGCQLCTRENPALDHFHYTLADHVFINLLLFLKLLCSSF